MNQDELLPALARRNPVPAAPPYDDDAERGLQQLLATIAADTGADTLLGPRHRMTRNRRAAVVAALGMAAAATVAVGTSGSSHPTTGSRTLASHSGHPSVPAKALDAKAVAYRTGQALSAASNYIVKANEIEELPSGTDAPRSVFWLDERDRQNFRTIELNSAGQPLLDSSWLVVSGHVVSLSIDYTTRQYSRSQANPADLQKRITQKARAAASNWTPPSTTLPAPATANDATGIARDLAKGTDHLLGQTTIEGRSVLHLSNSEPGMNRQIWVDPNTYLPVRMTARGSWGSYQIDYTWIPRTPQNLAKSFHAPIPAGFTQVR